MNEILNLEKYNFKEEQLTESFVNNLKSGDLFSFHCRDFIKFLGFKRCDKKFRDAFEKWLEENNIDYVISSRPLSKFDLNNIINAEKIVEDGLDKQYSPRFTLREWFVFLARESGKTYEEIKQMHIDNKRKFSLFEIKEDKQKLSGAFNGGCWLILLKN